MCCDKQLAVLLNHTSSRKSVRRNSDNTVQEPRHGWRGMPANKVDCCIPNQIGRIGLVDGEIWFRGVVVGRRSGLGGGGGEGGT
jgi:hypothetical protein